MRVALLLALGLIVVPSFGCSPTPPAGCARDVDCAQGTFCGADATCVSECSAAAPCAAPETCDVRGRCVPGGGDGGMPRDGAVDGATPDSGPQACVEDADCTDDTFCDGQEMCDATDPGADARGCVDGPGDPCDAAETCDDEMNRCLTACDIDDDIDGDSVRGAQCGGTDCDDMDVDRFPGNPEACDPAAPTHDEDCDPETFGFLDADGDTVTSAACCNEDTAGASVCGSDCDDASALRAPGVIEVCDGLDNDCGATDADTSVDEGVLLQFYPDGDGDGFGDVDVAPMDGVGDRSGLPLVSACASPAGYSADHTDCRDDLASTNPGAGEARCDMLDDNCNAMVDEGLLGSCTTTLPGVCAPGAWRCVAGGGRACTGTVPASCSSGATRSCMTCSGYPGSGTQTCDGCVYGTTCSYPPATLPMFWGDDPRVNHACGSAGSLEWWHFSSDPLGCSFVSSISQNVPPGLYAMDLYGRRSSDGVLSITMGAGATSVSVTGNHGSGSSGEYYSTVTWRQTSCGSIPLVMRCTSGVSCGIQSITIRRTGS